MEKLLEEYFELKDMLLDYTDEFHDAMFYDIQGYYEEVDFSDEEDREYYAKVLTKQVNAFKSILEAYKQIDYTFC
jgi:hypothetical protein